MENVFEATLCREQKQNFEGNQKDMALWSYSGVSFELSFELVPCLYLVLPAGDLHESSSTNQRTSSWYHPPFMVNVFFINVFLKNNTCIPLLQKKCRLARCFRAQDLWIWRLSFGHGYQSRNPFTCQNLFCFHLGYNDFGSLYGFQKVRCQVQKMEEQKQPTTLNARAPRSCKLASHITHRQRHFFISCFLSLVLSLSFSLLTPPWCWGPRQE